MNSRERILSVWNGKQPDHVPLTTWCFGFTPPQKLRWDNTGRSIKHWYSKRHEHLHTLPQSWDLEDDFKRVLAWQSIGVDDILDVSVPWSVHPGVTWKDNVVSAVSKELYPVMVREYNTPGGALTHAVRKTGEEIEDGWVIQPGYVPLIEDYNVPRAAKHIVTGPADVAKIRYLFQPPDDQARKWFTERVKAVKSFADKNGAPVQAWPAYGIDATVWFAGTEGAIMLAMDEPAAFGELIDIIFETDLARTELAVSVPGVDMVVQRGWYSSTDLWSPDLFEQYVYPHIAHLAALAHKHGKKFGYVMTTGVEKLGPRLAAAGVDVLYFIDPLQDRVSLEKAYKLLGSSITMVGGINTLSLSSGNYRKIYDDTRRAIDILGPTNRFILQPVDSLFPDTPWEGMEQVIKAWEGSWKY